MSNEKSSTETESASQSAANAPEQTEQATDQSATNDHSSQQQSMPNNSDNQANQDEHLNSSHSDKEENTTAPEPNRTNDDYDTANNSVTQDATSDASESNQDNIKTPPPPHKAKQKSSAGSRWVLYGALLLALAAAIFSGWTAYQQYLSGQSLAETVAEQEQLIQQQNNLLTALEASINKIGESESNLRDLIAGNKTADQELLDQQTLLRQQLATTQDRLRLLTNEGKHEWLLEQVYFYLELAQRKLVFEQQVTTAVALLSEADASLVKANDIKPSASSPSDY